MLTCEHLRRGSQVRREWSDGLAKLFLLAMELEGRRGPKLAECLSTEGYCYCDTHRFRGLVILRGDVFRASIGGGFSLQ